MSPTPPGLLDSLDKWTQSPWAPFYLWFGTNVLHVAVYWGMALPLAYFDLKITPSIITPYKIQPGANRPLKAKVLRRVIARVLFNQLILGTALLALGYSLALPRIQWRLYPLPSIHEAARQLFGSILVQEVGFYYLHRLFHRPWFYRHIHRVHHELHAPIAASAMYAHPVEHAIANLLPVAMGPIFLGCHVAVMYYWYAVATVVTILQHSGYHLPFLPSPEFHDYHHARPAAGNYGAIGLCDRLHSTDDHFRRFCPYASSHRVRLSLHPVPRVSEGSGFVGHYSSEPSEAYEEPVDPRGQGDFSSGTPMDYCPPQ